MNNRRLRILISISVLLIMIIGGGIVYMVHQHQIKEAEEHQKMVAIATSEEAKKVYEEYIKKKDSKSFTEEGLIKSYKVDKSSLEYNPMGGLMVRIVLNNSEELNIDFNLIDNGDGTYHSAYYTYSPELDELLGGDDTDG